MDPERCDKQTPIQFRCRKILAGASSEKDHDPEAVLGDKIEERQYLGDCFVSPTPEKPDWGSRRREASLLARKQLAEDFDDEEIVEHVAHVHRIVSKDDSVELPDRYKILANLFNRMETSIRLLGLRKIPATFQKVSKQVEILAKRKLLYSHLAQMKYVFSEAVNIEKILVHDPESLMMIPELKITLNKLVVEHIPESFRSASVALCDAFHARLLNFFMNHPEVTDIPEVMLPEPFSTSHDRNQRLTRKVLPEEMRTELPPQNLVETELQSNSLHLPSSFEKRFSKGPIAQEHRNEPLSNEEHSDSLYAGDIVMEGCPQKLETSLATETPTKGISVPEKSINFQMSESTPSKGALNLAIVTSETPAMQTPKRPLPTPQEKLLTDDESEVEAKATTSARRSLMYTPTGRSHQVNDSSCSSRVSGFSQDQLLGTKRSLLKEADENSLPDSVGDVAVDQSEMPNVNRISRDRIQNEMGLCLATFDAICFISRSTNCLEITKEELVHKILSNNLEIEETTEVEEQLNELELKLPEWISKKAVSGQFLYCIKKSCNSEVLRARLINAG